MKLWTRIRGSVALLVLFLAAVCLLSLSGVQRVEADGSFISAPGRVDMVYDLKRDTLYISYRIWTSSGGSSVLTDSGVLRYHVGSNSFLSRIPIYGNLMGVDLSPDGDTLLVADTFYSNDRIWVHQVDLPTLSVTRAEVARDGAYEGGSYTVAFGNDGAALVTSTFLGSGWTPLRRYHPKTGAWTVLPDVRQSTMLNASPDRGMVAFAESNISDGRWGTCRALDGQLVFRQGYTDGTSWFNYEIGAANGVPVRASHLWRDPHLRQRPREESGPAHGALSGSPPNLTYTPAPSYHGPDSFIFTVSDGEATSGPATVTISVTPVNDAPTAIDDAATTAKNTEVVIPVLANDTDGDGDPLSVTGASAPANGVATVNADGTIRYKPNKRYTGADSFTYTVNDGQGGVSTAAVTVQVSGGGKGNGGGGGGKVNNKP